MPRLPLLKGLKVKRSVTDSFLGLDRSLKIRSGEFYHMENLTSEHFPLMAARKPRGTVTTLTDPGCLAARAELLWTEGGRLFMGGRAVDGMELSPGEKSLVGMGAYILIFPDRLYLNTENPADFGSIDAEYESSGELTATLSKADGETMETVPVSDSPPDEPQNGQLWIDSSGSAHVLKQYSGANEMWVEQISSFVRLTSEGIGAHFSENDAVEISGLTGAAAGLNGPHIVEKRGEDYILIPGLLSQSHSQTEHVEICRKMPDMDFVTEAENRLWGCKYGRTERGTVNEIYACALGDFKNWNRFQGLADDSYRASVGTDGPFTAAVTHLGYPLFFKENALHKVYISANGAHRITDTACTGVQKGSHKSLANMGEKLFYKAGDRVCLYEGSLPRGISRKLGDEKYHSAVGGTLGEKYYISMQDEKGVSQLFVYDSQRGLWHREDSLQVRFFASLGSELYALCPDGRVLSMGGSVGEREKAVSWQAESGLMAYSEAEHKYLGRLIIRLKLPAGSWMDIFAEYDSSGQFEHLGHIEGSGTGSFSVPVRPRRCDHFRLRLEGEGEVRVYSIVKQIETGSDY